MKKRVIQYLFARYAKVAGIEGRSIHALRHSIADHLGHRNIQNTRIYVQISHPLREQVFRDLERHPKIVRVA